MISTEIDGMYMEKERARLTFDLIEVIGIHDIESLTLPLSLGVLQNNRLAFLSVL